MAKAGKPRHSGSTRTPPIIDHEPVLKKDDEKANTDKKSERPVPTQNALPKPQIENNKSTQAESNNASLGAKQQDDASKKQLEDAKVSQKMSDKQPIEKTTKSKTGSSLLGGIAGGIIALVIAAGLQWSGFLPTPAQETTAQSNNSQIDALQKQIDALKANQESQITATTPNDEILQDALNKANNASKTANDLSNKVAENAQTLAALKTTINGLGAQNGDTNAISALSAQISTLEDKAALTDELNKRVAENQGVLDQMRTRLNGMETSFASVENMSERLAKLEANEQAQNTIITDLQKNASTVEERILAANSNDHTRLIAANALKDAVNRGGSYINELQTFEKVAPQDISLDLLKTYANTGLPSGAELSKHFTKVADKIAATQYAAPENAGMTDKLWASARQLVVSRPVGNVEGTTPGDIAARMEVAIEKGDYESALTQWQTLPENAKAVSSDFVKTLMARRDADRLINQLITTATQPQTPQTQQ